MDNATLVYKINYNNENRQLKLENRSLYLIDKITSGFINEEDFIKRYYNKDKIFNFIKENGNIRGKIVIDYKKDIDKREEIQPLYNTGEQIVIKDDLYNNQLTEIEKARKLLFNSKNQIFARLLLSSGLLENELKKLIDLNVEEAKYAVSNNIKINNINNKYYVSFKSLLEYRINSSKLGVLREVYQDMLSVLKDRIMNLDINTLYFYNRQMRILIEKYKELISTMNVKNIKINNNKSKTLLKCCLK